MSNFISEISKYSQVEKATDYRFFQVSKSAIYMWYFPINFKTKGLDINSAHEHFYQNDFFIYNECTKLVIEDNRKKIKSEVTTMAPNNNDKVNFLSTDRSTTDQDISGLLLGLSAFSNPIYIGKAARDSSVSERIKDHLNLRTGFSQVLSERLLETNYTISDMIVRVVDLEKLAADHFLDAFQKDFDFAQYVERILINLFNPVYNIKN